MKVTVLVLPKPTVLDPQGAATAEAMRHLGFESARNVRVGKVIEFDADPSEEDKLEDIATDLLSNPVMEDCIIEIDDGYGCDDCEGCDDCDEEDEDAEESPNSLN